MAYFSLQVKKEKRGSDTVMVAPELREELNQTAIQHYGMKKEIQEATTPFHQNTNDVKKDDMEYTNSTANSVSQPAEISEGNTDSKKMKIHLLKTIYHLKI